MRHPEPLTAARHSERLADQVYELLLGHINSGEFSPGSRLPSEERLAARFDVSRPMVREALSKLRSDGIVTSRKGAGSFVLDRVESPTPPSGLIFSPITSLSHVKQFYEFRLGIEGQTAFLAAENRTPDDLKAIEKAMDNIETAIKERAVGVDPDYAFHVAIAKASANPYFETVMPAMQQAMKFVINLSRNLSLTRPIERLRVVEKEHKIIYDAIASQNPQEAQDAMRSHILNTVDRVFEGGSFGAIDIQGSVVD